MKRIISVILISLFLSGTIFAIDTGSAASLNGNRNLFTGIKGTELSTSDMKKINGEGLFGAIMGGFLGSVGGAMRASITTAYRTVTHREKWNSERNRQRIISGAKQGAVYGVITGFLFPEP